MADKMSKAELIQRIQRSYDALAAYLNSLNKDDLTGPASPEGWTAKDHLIHLTNGEAGIVAMLRHQPRLAAMGLEEDFVEHHTEDEINQRIYLTNRDRSLPDVLAAFYETHRQMMETLAGLREEELYYPYSYFQPFEPGEDPGTPAFNWIKGDTYAHYEPHLEWIQQLLNKDSQ
jgi:hypothetical protein